MNLLKKLAFNFIDPLGTVLGHVENWRPRNCKTEKDFEKSLSTYLREKMTDIPILLQAGSGRLRADIEVGGKVFVELKYNLDSTGKLQRLKGQIDDYKKSDRSLIIVVMGKTDAELKRDLKKFIADNTGSWGDEIEIDVIFK